MIIDICLYLRKYGAHLSIDGDAFHLVVKVRAGEDGLEAVVFFLLEAGHEVRIGHADAVLMSLDNLNLQRVHPALSAEKKALKY